MPTDNTALPACNTKPPTQFPEDKDFIYQIADSIPDLLYVIDLKKLKIIYINKAAKEALGYTPEQILKMKRSFIDIFLNPQHKEKACAFLKSFEGTSGWQTQRFNYKIKTRMDTWRYFHCRHSVFKSDEHGKPLQIIGIAQDITGDKKVEDNRIRLKLKQQKAISKAILKTQEEERKRIAEALHNGLGQVLYGVKLSLDILDPDTSNPKKNNKEIKKTIRHLLDDAIEETRTISFELMPAILKDFGLAIAIRDLLRKKLAKTSIRVSIHFSGLKNRLDPDLEIAIFRIVQEIINNVIKHAHASSISLNINKVSDYIQMKITDDGLGFNYEKALNSKGFGMRSIMNRLELLNGHLNIDSEPEKGSVFLIDIPLN
ncbi:MAG TPA: ATP-binding protein [Daejeonella sp.]|nr:ATP-binding protein [Daejeonella sp.]